MDEIAVIGNPYIISIFKLFDTDCYPVTDDNTKVFEEIYKKNYKIIFVTEELYTKYKHLIKEDVVSSQVTIIPDISGSKGLGEEKIRKLITKALGSDIIE